MNSLAQFFDIGGANIIECLIITNRHNVSTWIVMYSFV